MEIIAVLAFCTLSWLVWQLIKAKKFNRFKLQIERELKPKVIKAIEEELEATRSEVFPNNEAHQAATLFYYSQYKSRLLKAALQREIITEQWLKNTGNLRNAQHLFYVEKRFNP